MPPVKFILEVTLIPSPVVVLMLLPAIYTIPEVNVLRSTSSVHHRFVQ